MRRSADPAPAAARLRERLLHDSLAAPLLAVLLVAMCVVSPRGDFPLNDDWVYAKAVQGLLAELRYVGHPFAAANVVAQVLWGASFCAVLGFSFTALRVSTLVAAFAAAWATARCIRELGVPRRWAVLGGATLLTNPLFLNLSYTYMTDVPFIAASALSGLWYLRALRTHSARDALAGTLLAVLGFWVRQFGLLISLAFALTALRERIAGRRRLDQKQLWALMGPWLGCAAALLYQSASGAPTYPWTALWADVPIAVRVLFGFRFVFVAVAYFGLFLLPLTLPRLLPGAIARADWTRRRVRTFILGALAVDAVACLVCVYPMPLLTNMLYDLGVGPFTLRDAYLLRPGSAPVGIGAWWWLPTAAAVISGALLLTDLRHELLPEARGARPDGARRGLDQAATLFLLLWAVMLAAAPHNPYLPVTFDRYLLPPLVPLGILFARLPSIEQPRWRFRWSVVTCAAIYLFSLACLQDYMAWNRARWEAIDRLVVDRGVDPLSIDGGFEYNGWRTSDAFMAQHGTTDFNQSGDLGWWVLDDAYAVSYLPREGFDEIDQVTYYSYLGMTPRCLRILRRSRSAEPAEGSELPVPVRVPVDHSASE